MTRSRISYAVSLPPELAARLDEHRVRNSCSRSSVIRAALYTYLLTIETSPSGPPVTGVVPPIAAVQSPSLDDSRYVRQSNRKPHALPPKSELVDIVMPDASAEERSEATRRWFGYLQTLDRIVSERAARKPEKIEDHRTSKNERDTPLKPDVA